MQNYEPMIKQANRIMDKTDWLLAIAFIGALMAFTPLYASAALTMAHQREVPILRPLPARVLMNAMTPVKGVTLRPLTMRVPAPLPRHHH